MKSPLVTDSSSKSILTTHSPVTPAAGTQVDAVVGGLRPASPEPATPEPFVFCSAPESKVGGSIDQWGGTTPEPEVTVTPTALPPHLSGVAPCVGGLDRGDGGDRHLSFSPQTCIELLRFLTDAQVQFEIDYMNIKPLPNTQRPDLVVLIHDRLQKNVQVDYKRTITDLSNQIDSSIKHYTHLL